MSEVGKDVSRRDALKLAAGAVALGAALGVPRSALALSARGEAAYRVTLKPWYEGKLLGTISLTEDQAKLLGQNPGGLTCKIHGGETLLGVLSAGPEVQQNVRNYYKIHM